jgi:transposase-like protein
MEFKSIFDFIKTLPDEATCVQYLEEIRWAGIVVSPFDETSKVYKCKGGRYMCKNTGKYFNVKVGTIFEDTKIPLTKWFMALYIFSSHKKGISSYQLAKDISVTQKTAWFMLHRLRFMFSHPVFKEMLSGVVEADETYIGGKTTFKHKNKRDSDNAAGTGTINKAPIFGMAQRGGNVMTQGIKKADQATIHPIIKGHLAPGSILITDGHGAYKGLGKFYRHEALEHEQGEFARNQYHTANIDCFWSQLKRGITGLYHHITPKHIYLYAQEFTLRYNTRNISVNQRFDFILSNMENRLTYKTLTA